jgi:outer membrane protein OmpA-like peptidoglycan-associated protein
MKSKITIALLLVVVMAVISGCATIDKSYTGRKNTLVADIKPGFCTAYEKAKDWNRIAAMTNQEICNKLGCEGTERIVTKEVIKEVPVEKIVVKEVIKEVPVERVVEKVVEKETKKTYMVLPGVWFDFDKSTVKPRGQIELKKAVSDLKEKGTPTIEVAGHTDAVGTDAYNQKLSERRADAVKNYMAANGYPGDKIKVMGFGESKPVASNETVNGRTQNRRVEISIIGE